MFHVSFELSLFITFLCGIMFSPFSSGFIYNILFIICYELFFYMRNPEKIVFPQRVAIICVSLIGFMIGRIIFYPKKHPIIFKGNNKFKKFIIKILS